MSDPKPEHVKSRPYREVMDDHTALLGGLNVYWDKVLTTLRRVTALIGIAVLVISSVGVGVWYHANSMSDRMNALAARMDTIVSTQEKTRESQERTEDKVDDVGEQVAEARAETPTITIIPSDAGTNSKPQAAIIVKPKASPPLLPAMSVHPDGGSPPQSISIPVALPPGSKVLPQEDGGASPP
jgi:hypothetical protein